MHVQVRINRKVKMKSTKTQCYVAEKKFRERYTKIQLRSSCQRSKQLPFESGISRAISAVAILLCLSFLVSLVLQYWSVRSSKRKDLLETKQELLFHSNQDQFVRGCLRRRCLGTLKHHPLWLAAQNHRLVTPSERQAPTIVVCSHLFKDRLRL